jgi:glycerophosphoryl diester phosphodiesterase
MVTKIISHRGANKYAPQNTIPAFQKALEFNVEGFENDVHVTKDGVVVVCHNYTIDETSNGKGKIADYTFEELRKFDFGSYFSEEFAGTKIPSGRVP